MSDKEEMAEDRTDWAEDRTIMANERTFSSWISTGLGAVAVAIGLQAVFGKFEPTWAAKAVATVFLIAAIAIFIAARRKAINTYERLQERDVDATPSGAFTLLMVVLCIGAAGTGAVLWLL